MLFRWHIRYYILYFDWLIHTIFSIKLHGLPNYYRENIQLNFSNRFFSWCICWFFFGCNFCFHKNDINGHELNDKNSSDSLCILKIGSNVCFSQNIIKPKSRKMIIIISLAMLPKNKTVSIIGFSVFLFLCPNKLKWEGNTKRELMN